jgi:hypothetical protein
LVAGERNQLNLLLRAAACPFGGRKSSRRAALVAMMQSTDLRERGSCLQRIGVQAASPDNLCRAVKAEARACRRRLRAERKAGLLL